MVVDLSTGNQGPWFGSIGLTPERLGKVPNDVSPKRGAVTRSDGWPLTRGRGRRLK